MPSIHSHKVRDPDLSIPTEKLFDKIVIKKGPNGEALDQNGNLINLRTLDLKGSIALTRDKKHVGWVHVLIYCVQKVHTLIFRRGGSDVNLCHGFIVLGYPEKKADATTQSKPLSQRKVKPHKKPPQNAHPRDDKNNLVLAHGVFDGIRTGRRNYLSDPDITEIIFYRPQSESIRDMNVRLAYQTAHTPPAFREPDSNLRYAEKKAKFTIVDGLLSFFHNRIFLKKKPSMRMAYILADLLRGDQLLNKRERPREYFCTAYMISVLQGSYLLKALNSQEKKSLLTNNSTRKELAKEIYHKLNEKGNALSHTFTANKVCRLNPRWVMSCYAGDVLDAMSDVTPVG